MPTFNSQIVLSGAADAAGIAGIDNAIVKGSLKAFDSLEDLQAEPLQRLANNQLCFALDTQTWYQVTITEPDFFNTFEATATFNPFSSFGGGSTAGIFEQTGSFYSTSNDLQITGSFSLELDGISDTFSLSVAGTEALKVNEEGVLQFTPMETPTAVEGGFFLSSSGEFFVGG